MRRVGGKCHPRSRGEVGVNKALGSGSTTDINEGCGGRWGRHGAGEAESEKSSSSESASSEQVFNARPEPSRKRLRVRTSAGLVLP